MSEPNTDDLRIGKGIISFWEDGESDFRDLGFVPLFEVNHSVDLLEYDSAREGISVTALEVVSKVKTTIDFTMSQVNGPNLALFAMGTATTVGPNVEITALDNTNRQGILKCEGFNDVGQFVDWTGRATIRPKSAFGMVKQAAEWDKLEMQGTVVLDVTYGRGGKYVVRPQA